MSDAEARSGRVNPAEPDNNDPKRRVPVDTAAFEAAFAARGCSTGRDRADLLRISRRNVDKYRHGHIVPTLPTARRIAATLGRDLDELWPADEAAA